MIKLLAVVQTVHGLWRRCSRRRRGVRRCADANRRICSTHYTAQHTLCDQCVRRTAAQRTVVLHLLAWSPTLPYSAHIESICRPLAQLLKSPSCAGCHSAPSASATRSQVEQAGCQGEHSRTWPDAALALHASDRPKLPPTRFCCRRRVPSKRS